MFKFRSCILLFLLLFLLSCTYSRVTVYDNGKLRPNNITNFQTVDGKLYVAYFIEKYKLIKVDDEEMFWPSTFSPYENIWVDETDKKVKVTIRVINEHKIPYILVFNQETRGNFREIIIKKEEMIYNGKLPYQEHVVEVEKIKGVTEVWFEIYHKDKLYCFTRGMKFNY